MQASDELHILTTSSLTKNWNTTLGMHKEQVWYIVWKALFINFFIYGLFNVNSGSYYMVSNDKHNHLKKENDSSVILGM